jgi:putative intracellular protease/amidase
MSLQDPNVVNRSRKKRVAIVIANPSTSTTTGWPVGFWWSELTHSYFLLSEKGYVVDVFSPNGGPCQADALSDPRDPSGYSSSDLVTMGFIATPRCVALVEDTRPAALIDVDAYDAILVAGGQAPMFTFDTAETLQTKFVEFYERGKLAVALCHGVAILKYARLANGEHLAKGGPSRDLPTWKRTLPTTRSGT